MALFSFVLSLSVIVTVVPNVAVAAFPVTFPVMLPLKAVDVSVPVFGLYFKSPSDSKPIFHPSSSPSLENITTFF